MTGRTGEKNVNGAELAREEARERARHLRIEYDFPPTPQEARANGFRYWRDQIRNRKTQRAMPYTACDAGDIDRWAVNWLHHQGTRYDQSELPAIGEPGGADARSIVRERILEEISQRFPELGRAAGQERKPGRKKGG